jgi:hypothetical protein
MFDLWDVFQQGQINKTSRTADSAKRDVKHTSERLNTETLRLESKIDNLAIICQALVEILRDQGGVSEEVIQSKIDEIDARDGRIDGKMSGKPIDCPNCGRPTHTRQIVCMYCSASLPDTLLVEKTLTSGSKTTRK